MNDKKIKNIIVTILKRARSAKRECCFDTCKEPAIRSHLLQKNGLLNQISDANSQVMELAIDYYHSEKFVFKSIGINDAFTFFGFCIKHDTEIFKNIETGTIDFNDYKTQLLFSYRALMNEKRKKEIIIDSHNRILNSSDLKYQVDKIFLQNIEKDKEQQLLGIQDESYYEKIFIENIKNPELRNFKFISYELPKVEICSSGVFTYETTFEINNIEKDKINNPLTEIYFNLLPIENKTIVILGCENNSVEKCWKYISEFNTTDNNLALKKISNLLINQVENWLCSKMFYEKHLKNIEFQISKLTRESISHQDERRDLSFNLFQLLK